MPYGTLGLERVSTFMHRVVTGAGGGGGGSEGGRGVGWGLKEEGGRVRSAEGRGRYILYNFKISEMIFIF